MCCASSRLPPWPPAVLLCLLSAAARGLVSRMRGGCERESCHLGLAEQVGGGRVQAIGCRVGAGRRCLVACHAFSRPVTNRTIARPRRHCIVATIAWYASVHGVFGFANVLYVCVIFLAHRFTCALCFGHGRPIAAGIS